MENIGRLRGLEAAAAEQPELKQAYVSAERAGRWATILRHPDGIGGCGRNAPAHREKRRGQDEIEDALYLLQEAGRITAQNKIREAGGAARNAILLIRRRLGAGHACSGFLAALIMRQWGARKNELQFEKSWRRLLCIRSAMA